MFRTAVSILLSTTSRFISIRKLHDGEDQCYLCQKLIFGPIIKTGCTVIEEQAEVFRCKELTHVTNRQQLTRSIKQTRAIHAWVNDDT